MTIDDLRRVLTACAGEDETISLSGDYLELAFTDLGYDSLAMMEIAARINQEYSVHVSDDEITELATPQAVLDRVNYLLVEAA
jgi:minimal PKS acyl carrier protein